MTDAELIERVRPREVWVVLNKDGVDIAYEHRHQAMEQAAIMAGDFPEFSPWLVEQYVVAAESDAALSRAEKAEAECEKLRHDIERHIQVAADLATENEGLRKDAERYRWLRFPRYGSPIFAIYADDYQGEAMLHLDVLDAAIDAAIAAAGPTENQPSPRGSGT